MSHFSEKSNKDPCKYIGTFPCGTGEFCDALDRRLSVTLPQRVKWYCKHFVNCYTIGIVYLLQCPCGAFYVGKTRRPFKKRIHDHIYAGGIGYFKSPIGHHIAFSHNYQFDGFLFLPLETFHVPPRGGDWDNTILCVEARWIFKQGPTLHLALMKVSPINRIYKPTCQPLGQLMHPIILALLPNHHLPPPSTTFPYPPFFLPPPVVLFRDLGFFLYD